MFAKYEYAAGSSLANIMSDIVAILTGETVVANLSVACVDANSYINSTDAAGWTVYDAAAGTNAQCLRALDADASTYKYIVVDLNTANKQYCKVYESWNPGAHTGTNLSYRSNDSVYAGQKIDSTTGGVLYIGATARGVIFNSFVGGIWGIDVAAVYSPEGCFERSRAAGWDTAEAGYPPYIWFNGYSIDVGYSSNGTQGLNSAPRIKGLSGDLTGSNACFDLATEFGSGAGSSSYPIKSILPSVRGFDASLNLRHFMHEIGLVRKDQGLNAGKLLGNIYLTTPGYGSAGDELSYNGNIYFIMTCGQSTGTGAGGRIAVPKF